MEASRRLTTVWSGRLSTDSGSYFFNRMQLYC